jgi:uncharacterized protein
MIIRKTWNAALTGAALLAAVVFGGSALAQSQPSAEAVDTARQIITLKGGENIFNTLIPGVIEQGRYMFEQQNPNLGNPLREVATKLRNEFASRQAELNTEVAKVYASRFTEKEMKDLLAFYQSPLGRKLIVEEPRAIDQSMTYAQDWARRLSDEVLVKMRAEMKKLGHDI